MSTNYRSYIFSLVLGGMLAFLPIISSVFSGFDGVIPIFLNSVICSFLLICWLWSTCFKNIKLEFNVEDICFALYLCYGILRIVISEAIFNPIIACEWFGLTIIYLVVKLIEIKYLNIVYVFLLLGGVMQAILGVCQYVNLLGTQNLIFKITGSFNNLGHWGGFLALTVLVNFYMWREKKYSIIKWNKLFPCALFIQIFALIFSDSRAAWLAVMVPLGYLFVSNSFYRPCYKRWYIKLSFPILLFGILTSLYFYKKSSADVRLLTWHSSLLLFKDAPLLGHGIGSFAANYMPYQACYLDKHVGSNDAIIADNNILTFNELIHLACEQGGVGLFLFTCLLACALTNKNKTKQRLFARLGLIGLFVFALFSYPASLFPIKVCFPLFLGVLSKDRTSCIVLTLKKTIVVLVVGIICLGVFFNVRTYKNYHDAYASLNNGDYVRDPSKNYYCMKHNKNFLYLLSVQYLKHDLIAASMQVKKELLDVAPTSSLLCDLGMLYLHCHELDSARMCFKYAKTRPIMDGFRKNNVNYWVFREIRSIIPHL